MYFVLDDNNNRVEAYDKEGVLAALEKAIADGSLSGLTADASFISKIRCCVSGDTNKIAFVTQAKYNELVAAATVEEGVYYFITDETTLEDIEGVIDGILNGDTAVGLANNASNINGLPLLRSEGVLQVGTDIISVKRPMAFEQTKGDTYIDCSASHFTDGLYEITVTWSTDMYKFQAYIRRESDPHIVSGKIIDIFTIDGVQRRNYFSIGATFDTKSGLLEKLRFELPYEDVTLSSGEVTSGGVSTNYWSVSAIHKIIE